MTAAWPLPEPDDPVPPPKLTLYQQRVSDSITNTYEPEGAPASREPRRIDWRLVLEQSLDEHDLDPSDFDWPESELPGPEWPDPSWPGFTRLSGSYVLAVSPQLIERHPDRAASLWEVFPAGQERHQDPEPDLEAEP